MPEITERAEKIRRLNDAFRFFMFGGEICLSQSIGALDLRSQRSVLEKIRLFDAFDKANDPYGEHDFGIIKHEDQSVYFKIDYYNKNLTGASEDAANLELTTRVMTVMFANEY